MGPSGLTLVSKELETVETVSVSPACASTQLKLGVNERDSADSISVEGRGCNVSSSIKIRVARDWELPTLRECDGGTGGVGRIFTEQGRSN